MKTIRAEFQDTMYFEATLTHNQLLPGGLSVSVLNIETMPVKQTENLAEANASEEDKLKAVMYQSSLCYYSSR